MLPVSETLQGQCLGALATAAQEVAPTWLGGLQVEPLTDGSTSGEHGALVSVAAASRAMNVGIFMTPEVGQALSKYFVGLEPDDDDLPLTDVADALCELANVLVGVMKRLLAADHPFTVGLPLFFDKGRPQHPGAEASSQLLRIGGFSVALVVIG